MTHRHAITLAMILAAAVLPAVAVAAATTQNVDPATQPLRGPDESRRISSGRSDGMGVLQTVLALALVVGLIFAIRYVMRRFGTGGSGGPADAMKIVARRSLSSRHQAVIVQVGTRRLLIGLGPTGMDTLADVTDDMDRDEPAADASEDAATETP